MLAALVLLALILGIAPALVVRAAAVRFVIPGGVTSGACGSWATACDLQFALGLAISGDELWVMQGTYKPTSVINRNATFQLKTGVGIYGGFDGTETSRAQRDWVNHITILSGDIGAAGNSDNSYHVVTGSGTNATAVLDGFTITGGNADTFPIEYNGGGMFNIGGSPSLANVTFTGNSAVDNGGGMYNSNSNPSLTNVDFTGNSAIFNGGGLFNSNSTPSLSSVGFSSNTAGVDGGGMYNYLSSPILTGVSFTSNSAVSGGGIVNEGGSPSLTDVTFDRNTASNLGGAMYNHTNSSPSLSDISLTLNSAGANGGGIYSSGGSLSMTDVTFITNTATLGGGMYNSSSNPSLTNVTFDSNSATNSGGGMYNYSNSHPNLAGVTFTSNTAISGGGMYNSASSPTLAIASFTGNSAISNGNGGGMYNLNSNPSLTEVTFTGNSGKFGGGVYNDGSSPGLTDVALTNNTATNGGGMYDFNISSPSLITVTFANNTATTDGGGIYNSTSSPSLRSVSFDSNSAGSYGGGIYNHTNSNPSLAYVTFSSNSAGQYGGGMYTHSSAPTLVNVTFSTNSAIFFGGGMYLQISNPSLANITFNNNLAAFGGGMYNSGSNPTLVNVTFYSNSVTTQGGGIYNTTSSPSIYNSILWGNNPNQVYNLAPSTPTITYSDVQGGCPAGSTCTNVINTNPLFVNPVAGDLRLGGTSPAIDAADDTRVPADTLDLDHDANITEPLPYDLAGNPRFIDVPTIPDTGIGPAPIVDMGAYERGVNAPVAVNDAYTTNEDTPLSVSAPGVLGNDTDHDGDPVTAILNVDPSHGTLSLSSNGSFLYTPALNYDGADSFTYHAYDGILSSNIATVNLTITAINDPPVLNLIGNKSGDELTLISFTATATDPDIPANTLTFSLDAGAPSGASINSSTGNFTWTPTEVQGPGVYPVTVRVTDNGTPPLNDFEIIQITVNEVNEPPIAVDDEYTTDEDTPLNVPAPGVLLNDTDPDGNPMNAILDVGPTNGTLTLNLNGSFVYTPTLYYNGEDSFTYHAYDGELDSNIATVTINISSINNPPVAMDDEYTTDEDAPLDEAAPGVLSNDTDVDGDALTAILDVGPTHGTLTLNLNGSFVYTPTLNYNGADSFTYHAFDGELDSNIATVSLTINPINNAPVAVNDAYLTDEDTPLSVSAPGVLTNDADVEADALTAILDVGPTHGTLNLNLNGSFVYTPTLNYNGADTFTYHAFDGELDSNIATVSLTVDPVNDVPIVDAGPDQIADEGDLVEFAGSFIDPDWTGGTIEWDFGDGFTASDTLTPAHTYADNGTYTVTLIVTDSEGATGSDWLLASVSNVAPALGELPDFSVLAGEQFTITGVITDPGNLDTHQVIILWAPGITETVDLAEGVTGFTASYAYTDIGEYPVLVTVSDNEGGETSRSFNVLVTQAWFKMYLPLISK